MVVAPCHIPRSTICLQITIEENSSNHIDPCNWSYHPPVQPACTLIAIGGVLLQGSFLLLVVLTILLGLWTHWCFLQKKQYIASEPSWKYCWKIGTESFLRIHHVETHVIQLQSMYLQCLTQCWRCYKLYVTMALIQHKRSLIYIYLILAAKMLDLIQLSHFCRRI